MGIFRKSKPAPIPYDPACQEPVVRRSICTGEMTAGFVDRKTGKFTDYMRLLDQQALEEFCESVGLPEVRTIY